MLKTASSTLSCTARLSSVAIGTETFGSPSVMRRHRQRSRSSSADRQREHQIARRPGGRHQHVVAPRMPQLAHVDRHRLRPADQRRAGDHRDQRKHHRADRIGVHDRVQRDAAEQPRRRIAEAIGRPRMRHFVHRQRKQQDDEADENLREVDVQQGVKGYGRLAKKARTASATFAPTDGRQLLARRAPHAGQAAERRQQRLAPPRHRRRAHRRAPSADRASSARWRWNVTAKRCASSRIR